MTDERDKPPSVSSAERTTDEIDPRDMRVSWPMVIAQLGELGDWQVHALRLGTLARMRQLIEYAAHPGASMIVVDRMRELVEALARMPWQHDEGDEVA